MPDSLPCEPPLLRRQETQQAYQLLNVLQLSLLDATATFETLVIVFHQPEICIPVSSLPGLCQGRGRGQQKPFQWFLAFWCLFFPDPNDPHAHGLGTSTRLIARWQERHRSKCQVQLRRANLTAMSSSLLERMSILTLPHAWAQVST